MEDFRTREIRERFEESLEWRFGPSKWSPGLFDWFNPEYRLLKRLPISRIAGLGPGKVKIRGTIAAPQGTCAEVFERLRAEHSLPENRFDTVICEVPDLHPPPNPRCVFYHLGGVEFSITDNTGSIDVLIYPYLCEAPFVTFLSDLGRQQKLPERDRRGVRYGPFRRFFITRETQIPYLPPSMRTIETPIQDFYFKVIGHRYDYIHHKEHRTYYNTPSPPTYRLEYVHGYGESLDVGDTITAMGTIMMQGQYERQSIQDLKMTWVEPKTHRQANQLIVTGTPGSMLILEGTR
jgi:hypothetical protein